MSARGEHIDDNRMTMEEIADAAAVSDEREVAPSPVGSDRVGQDGGSDPSAPSDGGGDAARVRRAVLPEQVSGLTAGRGWTDPSDSERARIAFDLQLTQRMPEIEAVVLKMLEAVYRSAPAETTQPRHHRRIWEVRVSKDEGYGCWTELGHPLVMVDDPDEARLIAIAHLAPMPRDWEVKTTVERHDALVPPIPRPARRVGGESCPSCHEDCIGWVVDGARCGRTET